jgi:type II secretory ATPase GspE/PulE/Tfp pilus assembly ATPase PilB-like protein
VDALKQRATDIHVEPYEDEVLIRFRVDGVLQDRLRLPRTHQAPLTSRIKVMAKMDIAEHMAPQDGRIGITLGDRAVDIRVGLIPTQHGERLAMRMLDKGYGLLTLEDLGMEKNEREVMESLIYRPHGMILFTGPTGSGKTTSLYAILQALAKPQVNIITVEDPIEYSLPGVAQIQVNEKAGVTFASALRSILRQDPDIVMIGEMRDFETAHIGVQASLTGHLVLSTLHTNDSIGAVIRLVDMGVEPYLAASCIIGTVAQRLARRLCPHCRRPVDPPALMARQGLTMAYEPVGCPQCNNTGYRGRLGLYEQFVLNEEIQEAVSLGAPASKLREIARKRSFRTLWEIGLEAVSTGKTSPEELTRVAGEE